MNTVENIKDRLAKIRNTPSGSIPPEDLIGASNLLLPKMRTFCEEKFPWGRLSTFGKYWELPKVDVKVRSDGKTQFVQFNIRISLRKGGFYDWDDPSCRYPMGNPLLLWMIADDVVLNDEWKASKADILRSIRDIQDWTAELEQGRNPVQPEEDPKTISAIREIVSISVESAKPLSAKKIWDLVVNKCGIDECKAIPELS